jgi:hypothetical protein
VSAVRLLAVAYLAVIALGIAYCLVLGLVGR